MQSLTLTISGKTYTISLGEDNFDREVECIKKYISIEGNNEIKTLLYAYLKKCYEMVELQRELEDLESKLDSKS